MKKITFQTLLALLLMVSFSQVAFSQSAPQMPVSTDGGELFIQYRCSRCHTIGRGVFVGPDLKGVGEKYTKDEIVRWIENPQVIYNETGKMPVNEGFPPMPPMQVPPEAAAAITEYLLTVSPPEDTVESGTITGRVLNGGDGSPKHGVGVTITPFMGDKQSGDAKTLISGQDGSYTFKALQWNRSYTISINYKGAEYSTDKMVFKPGEDTITLDLPVFEPTLTDENIRVNETHLIIQVLEGEVTVADLSVLENTAETIYIGGKDLPDGRTESVRYSLPKGAYRVSFIHGLDADSVVTTETGFSETTSIMPGPKRSVFSYNVPFESGKALIEKEIIYPTGSFLLLALDTQNSFKVKGLTEEEPVEINNERYLKWTGEDLKAGDRVIVEVGTGAAGFKEQYLTYGAIGIVLLIVIAGMIYSAKRKPKEDVLESKQAGNEPPEISLQDRRSSLIKEIAELDDKFESGGITETEYTKLRESKKNELLDVTKRLKGT